MHRAVFTISTLFLQITIRSEFCFAASGLVILAFTMSMRHSETIGGFLERPHRKFAQFRNFWGHVVHGPLGEAFHLLVYEYCFQST